MRQLGRAVFELQSHLQCDRDFPSYHRLTMTISGDASISTPSTPSSISVASSDFADGEYCIYLLSQISLSI
jgi:hypothetical protein